MMARAHVLSTLPRGAGSDGVRVQGEHMCTSITGTHVFTSTSSGSLVGLPATVLFPTMYSVSQRATLHRGEASIHHARSAHAMLLGNHCASVFLQQHVHGARH